ncbi:MAG: BNR-4 repeat-containing protein, partial [Planctomycetota bacterium]
YPADRTICFMRSSDGVKWSEWTRLATIDKGHYQVSYAKRQKAGTAFNYHPEGKGLNWRTNLYYIETPDFGKTWQTADGKKLILPISRVDSPALVHDYQAEGLNVYLKDIQFDKKGMPVVLFVTSRGYQSGPQNDPRTWTTARWTGKEWDIRPVTTSDNNYDMGSLYIEDDGNWVIIGPTEAGPQAYNPGGEIGMWKSKDMGKTWKKVLQLTNNSKYNHTYVRRPLNAHCDFCALWADGHGRRPSESNLYFCDEKGIVRILPREMNEDFITPQILNE